MLIGVVASVPLGPVALLVMQKTFCYGRQTGFAAGIGSAVADTFFALVSLFALGWVQDFIATNEGVIMLVGGLVIAIVGVFAMLRRPLDLNARPEGGNYFSSAFQAAGCALLNPGALAFMLALVAVFRLDIESARCPMWLLVLSVFAGALLWWLSFAYLSDKLRAAIKSNHLHWVTIVAGAAVVLFGLLLVGKGLCEIFV
ncbi:MAG: LysE family transporter [Bacteroidales bacterium]|nr:LysE family transporter [Bacteroidales bacterium]